MNLFRPALFLCISLTELVIGKLVRCPDYCTCDTSVVKCVNFDDFSQLDFRTWLENATTPITKIDRLDLKPNRPILVDDSLRLDYLKIERQVILRNIRGFALNSNPFRDIDQSENKIELKLYDSVFEFYETNTTRLDSKCQSDLTGSLLAKFSKLWLNENMIYSNNLCPYVFNDVNFDIMILNFLNETNKFGFKKIQYGSQKPMPTSKIDYLFMFNVKLDRLDASFLDDGVFSSLKTLHIYGSLDELDTLSFRSLRSVILELNNFGQFIINEFNSRWIENLHTEHNQTILVHLNDKQQEFEYTDEEFCLFKTFPRYNVLPVIKTKPSLACSCTLLWLMQSFRVNSTSQSLNNVLLTKSVEKCANKTERVLYDKCEFEARISACNEGRVFTTKKTRSFLFQQSNVMTNLDESRTNSNDTTVSSETSRNFIKSLVVVLSAIGFFAISTFMGVFLYLY